MKENFIKANFTFGAALRFIHSCFQSTQKKTPSFFATKKINMIKGFVTNTTPALFDESATKFTRVLLIEVIKVNIPTAFLNL